MADSISATPPKSQALLKLSELLRVGAEKVKPYERIDPNNPASALPLVSGTLESLGKGVEGWNYGDSPIDTRANTPLVNSRTADMAGALPVGAGVAASKAALIPAIPAMFRYTDKLRAGRLASQIAKANEMRQGGASLDDIWDATKLYLQPGHSGATTPAAQAKWGFEIPYGEFAQLGPDERMPLSAVLEAPELFKLLPALRHMDVATGNKSTAPLQTNVGHFDRNVGPLGEIAMANRILKRDPAQQTRTLHHELNHGINSLMDQSGSTGYAIHHMNDNALMRVPAIANRIEELRDSTLKPVISQLRLVENGPGAYNRNWEKSSGEILAEEAGLRAVNQTKAPYELGKMPQTARPQVADNLSAKLSMVLQPLSTQPLNSPVHGLSPKLFADQLVMLLRKPD